MDQLNAALSFSFSCSLSLSHAFERERDGGERSSSPAATSSFSSSSLRDQKEETNMTVVGRPKKPCLHFVCDGGGLSPNEKKVERGMTQQQDVATNAA